MSAYDGIDLSVVVQPESLVGMHTLSGVTVSRGIDDYGFPTRITLCLDEQIYQFSDTTLFSGFECARIDCAYDQRATHAEPIEPRVIELRLDGRRPNSAELVLFGVDEATGLVIVAIGTALDPKRHRERFIALWNPDGWMPRWMEDATNGVEPPRPVEYKIGNQPWADLPNYDPWSR